MAAQAPATSIFKPDRRVWRRRIVNKLMEALALVAALLAVAVLVVVVLSVLRRGFPALNWDLITKPQALFGEPGGGIANAIVGSIVIVAIATVIAVPVGVLIAVFVNELAPPWLANPVRLALDVINGLPTIVTGIFIFTLLVLTYGQSALCAGIALSIVALPLVARSTQEVLRLVPTSLREASLALGSRRWRSTLGIVLPAALGGILTGTTLAIARVAGETAPLLFTSSITSTDVDWNPLHPLQAIPLTIFEYSEQPDPKLHEQAWAAGIVLLAFVLLTSLVAKALLARSRRKLSR